MPSYVVVYWSLVVELAFYLVVTVLLLIGNLRRYKIAIFIAITLAFISPFIVSNRVQFIQFWGEFVCGLLLYQVRINS
jgi:peptidoglycan/LPS O-acetylase OafA/YrhL